MKEEDVYEVKTPKGIMVCRRVMIDGEMFFEYKHGKKCDLLRLGQVLELMTAKRKKAGPPAEKKARVI